MDRKLNQDEIDFSSIFPWQAFKINSKTQQNNPHSVLKSIDEFRSNFIHMNSNLFS